MVAVLGKFDRVLALYELEAARLDARCEFFYLIARVVDVELAPDIVAGALEHGGQSIAQHAAACVAHVHGAGGICRDELDHELFAAAHVAASVAFALGGDIFKYVAVPFIAHAKVHEARARDLDGLEPASVKLHIVDERLSRLARRHTEKLGACHGEVRGVISVCGVLGYLDAAPKLKPRGELAFSGRGNIRPVNELGYLILGHLYHICHIFCSSQLLSFTLMFSLFLLTTACSMLTT